MVGAQQKTVSEWESGLYEPDIETLGRIAEAAGATVGWLVAGESPEAVDDGIRKALIGVRAVVDEMLSDLRNDRDKLYGELAMAGTVKRAEEPPIERIEEIDVEPPPRTKTASPRGKARRPS